MAGVVRGTSSDIPSATSADGEAADAGTGLSRRRRVVVGIVVVVAALLLGLSTYATWTRAFALNTDVWTATSGELIADPTIRDALAVYVTSQLFTDQAVRDRVSSALPSSLQPLAGPVAITIGAATEEAVARVLATDAVQRLFVAANRLAHSEFVKVIEDDDVTAEVQLDLGALIAEVGTMIGLPPTFTAGLASQVGTVTILQSDELATVRRAAHILELLSFWLLIAVVALWALAIYLSPGRRRQTLLWILTSVIAIGILLLVGRRLLGSFVVDRVVEDPVYVPAGNAVWEITTGVLKDSTVATIFFATIALLGLQLAGPGRRATAIRRWLAPWMRDYPVVVWAAWGLAVLLVLLYGPSSQARTLLAIVIIVVLSAIGLWALRREILAEFPDAQHPERGGPSALKRARASLAARISPDRDDDAETPPEDPAP